MERINKDNALAYKKYWNNKKIIKHFCKMKPKDYWYKYFSTYKNSNNMHVLDLGCGGGRYTEMFLNLGFKVMACDLHYGMIQATRRRIRKGFSDIDPNEIILQADMTDLPFTENTFDIILSNGIYHNANSGRMYEKALFESARVLKKKGELCINVFVADEIDCKLNHLYDNVYLTPDNTPMVLIESKKIIDNLLQIGIRKKNEPTFYTTTVDTGDRFVMRGVFEKNDLF